MSDYGAYSRKNLQDRLNIERRKKHLRRMYYHALDYVGAFLWSVGVIIVTTGIIWMWVIERTK